MNGGTIEIQQHPGKNDIQHKKYYQWPEYCLGEFLRNSTALYTKWFLPINNANIFQTDINKNLADIGGVQQAEKELDKNVLEIKNLVQKIGDLSKIKFKQKNFFLYDESNYINRTFSTELNKKLQIYGLISTSTIGIKTTNLIRPENSLKIRVLNNKYMDHIVLQLKDIRKPGTKNKLRKGYKFFNFMNKT